jgi:adenosylhomocysteine nucleosidase
MFGKQDVLIVCALEQETQGQLDDYYPDVIYTGVGKVNATYKLTSYLESFGEYMPYKIIINYGTAGSRDLPIGELVDCTKFTQRDMDVTGMGFMKGQTPFENDVPIALDYDQVEFNPIGKKLRCGTGDNFVQTDEDTYSDVYDMEAYALAKVCFGYKVDFISFKYITDNANEHSAGDWEDNLADGIVEFKEKVLEKL